MSFCARTAAGTCCGVVLALIGVSACSEDRPPPSGNARSAGGAGGDASISGPILDAGPDDGAARADPEGGPPVCNTVNTTGSPLVPQTAPGGALPMAMGTSISPGTYWLTERDIYGDVPDDAFVRRAMVVDGSSFNVVEGTAATATDVPALTTRTLGYQIFGGIGLSLRESCPASRTVTNAHFTATDTTLTLYFPDLGTAEVYTRR